MCFMQSSSHPKSLGYRVNLSGHVDGQFLASQEQAARQWKGRHVAPHLAIATTTGAFDKKSSTLKVQRRLLPAVLTE